MANYLLPLLITPICYYKGKTKELCVGGEMRRGDESSMRERRRLQERRGEEHERRGEEMCTRGDAHERRGEERSVPKRGPCGLLLDLRSYPYT